MPRDSLTAALGAAVVAAREIGEARTHAGVADATADGLVAVLGCDRCVLARLGDAALTRFDEPGARAELLEAEVGAAASALQSGRARFVAQASAWPGGGDEGGVEAVSVLALPLVTGEGPVGAAICSWAGAREPVGPDTTRLATLVAGHAALALARLDADRRLTEVEETDPLTGARTRRSLDGLLAALRDRGTPHALVLIDLDGYGDYVARRGPEAGDRLLVGLAGLVARECREGDMVARAGADAFALVLPRGTAEAGAAAAVRIVEAVADWGHEDTLTASAGVAGVIADSSADALRLAEAALEEARRGSSGAVGLA